jgi:hypothetical protein
MAKLPNLAKGPNTNWRIDQRRGSLKDPKESTFAFVAEASMAYMVRTVKEKKRKARPIMEKLASMISSVIFSH